MTPAVVHESVVRVARRPNRLADRVFFTLMILLLWASVLWGFAHTYFLAGMVAAPLPNKLIHFHGAAFTLWMVLLLVQTLLISARQVKIHMTLGLAGFGLAVVMVVLGTLAAADALRRGSGPLGLDPKTFYIVPMTSICLFAVFVCGAYVSRRKPEAHKRLILIATIALMDAAVGRWPVLVLQQHPPLQDFVLFAFLLAIVVFDLFQLRRVSVTTIWASLLLVAVHLTRVPLGMTAGWHSFADWVIRRG